MPNKPTKNAKNSPEKTADSIAGNWFTRFLFRPRLLLLLAMAVSTAVLWPRIVQSLPDLSQFQQYRFRTADIELKDRPDWIPHDLVARVIERANLPEEMSLLDDSLTQKVAEAFLADPWVTGVRVRKSAPRRVEAELSYRKPVAMVRVPSGLYPVDVDGVLLPPDDFTAADVELYPVVTNVQTTPQGPAGTEWGDAAVSAAARLANVLGPNWKRFQLAAIQLPRQTSSGVSADDLIFELTTPGGSRIIWGRTPGSGHPGELTAKQKIGRLEKYLSLYGSFDQANGPYEIDIRHWQEISYRPLSARPAPKKQ